MHRAVLCTFLAFLLFPAALTTTHEPILAKQYREILEHNTFYGEWHRLASIRRDPKLSAVFSLDNRYQLSWNRGEIFLKLGENGGPFIEYELTGSQGYQDKAVKFTSHGHSSYNIILDERRSFRDSTHHFAVYDILTKEKGVDSSGCDITQLSFTLRNRKTNQLYHPGRDSKEDLVVSMTMISENCPLNFYASELKIYDERIHRDWDHIHNMLQIVFLILTTLACYNKLSSTRLNLICDKAQSLQYLTLSFAIGEYLQNDNMTTLSLLWSWLLYLAIIINGARVGQNSLLSLSNSGSSCKSMICFTAFLLANILVTLKAGCIIGLLAITLIPTIDVIKTSQTNSFQYDRWLYFGILGPLMLNIICRNLTQTTHFVDYTVTRFGQLPIMQGCFVMMCIVLAFVILPLQKNKNKRITMQL